VAYLKPYDLVAIISPSGSINKTDNVKKNIEFLKNKWKLNVVNGDYIFNSFNFFAGTDNQRFEDLQKFLNDPDIKAIFCTRGGYGLMRLLPLIDLNGFRNSPKIVIGFSDITSLLNLIYQRTSLPTIHGPMLNNFYFEENNQSSEYLYEILFIDKSFEYLLPSSKYNITGNAEGILIGGNLSIIYSLQGTPYEIDTNDKILFIEDINEKIYHIERMLLNLKYSGKFKNLKGLIVGDFINIKDTTPSFGLNIKEIILNIVKDYKFPVIFVFPAGHGKLNYPLIIGKKVTIIVDNNTSKILIHNDK